MLPMTERPADLSYSWTNHPLVDMGIAALVSFADREKPDDLTSSDLEKFARYAERAYFSPELGSYLTVLFTSNFINPNPNISADKKKQSVKEILGLYAAEPNSSLAACSYCSQPSIRVAHRDLVPMLTGREAINFFPGGYPGLALCGKCILALQALSIGAPMCSGRALVVSCDNPKLTLDLVKGWQPEIRKRIQLSEQNGQRLPAVTRPLTRTVEALTRIEAERVNQITSSITVYHLSNSGMPQATNVDIYFLPTPVVQFVVRASAAKYAQTWKELVRQAWESPPKPKRGEAMKEAAVTSLRNYLYEDLFSLPDRAARFIRIYFLREAVKRAQGPGDPRYMYRGWKAHIPGLWDITTLFLQEVVSMDAGRIKAIGSLGDTLADEIATEDDSRLWWRIYGASKYREARFALIQTSRRRLKRGLGPVLSLEEFLEVFEEGEEFARADWRLAWDLVIIRTIEQLYAANWFQKNPDVLNDEGKKLEAEEE